MKVTIANGSLSFLHRIYDKLAFAEFDTTKEGLKHFRNLKKIGEAANLLEDVKKKLSEKYHLEDEKKADVKGANTGYAKMLSEETELELDEISESVVNQIKMSAVELGLLEELGIVKFEVEEVEVEEVPAKKGKK